MAEPPAAEAQASPVESNDICEVIKSIDDNGLFSRLNDNLDDVVDKLQQRHRAEGGEHKAKIVLGLEFGFDGKLITVAPTVKVILPEPKNGKGIFWVTKSGGLSRQNPAQLDAFASDARDVSTAPPISLKR